MHELLRQYAADRLAQAADGENIVRDQHCAYYCTLLKAQSDALEVVQQPAIRMSIANDYGNIAAAWDWATDKGQTARLFETIDSLSSFFVRLARVQEGLIQLGKAVGKLEELRTNDPTDTHLQYVYVKVLAHYGNFVDIVGRRAEARKLLQKSLECFSLPGLIEIDTRALRALILGWLGDTFHGDEAQQYYTQAMELSQSVGAERHVAEMLLAQSRTMIASSANSFSQAKLFAEAALAIHYKLDDKTGLAWSLHTLSRLALYQGDYKTCEQMSLESLAIHQQLEQVDGVAHRLGTLAMAMLVAGKFEATQRYGQEALSIWTDLGFQGNALEEELLLGLAFLHQGDYAAARFQSEQSLRMARALGRREEIAGALYLSGKAALAEERNNEAQRYLQESLERYQDLALGSNIACTLALIALTAHKLGNQTEARQSLIEAVRITIGMQHFAVVLRVLPVAALLLAEAGHIKEATILHEWTARQPFVANSRWLLSLIGQPLEFWLELRSSLAGDIAQPTSDPHVWKTLVSQLHADLVDLNWSAGT